MTRPLLVLALLSILFSGSSIALAQDDEEAAAEDAGAPEVEGAEAQQASEDETPYEPDQRGATEDEEEEGLYEPDQRGVAEPVRVDPMRESQSAPADQPSSADGGETISASEVSRPIGFDLQFTLGGGGTSLGLLSNDNLLRPFQLGGGAASVGFYAGVHYDRVSIGPRVDFAIHDAFTLVSMTVEAQIYLLDGAAQPYVRAGIGYGVALATGPDLGLAQGLTSDVGFGFAGRLGGHFQLGAEASATYLHLDREGVTECVEDCTSGSFDLREAGAGDGLGFRLRLFFGLTF